jgi:xanthine dehydrogenase molybdenum-binding subunit
MTAASRIAATSCNAYAIAAEDAKRQILEAAAAELNTPADKLDMKNRRIFVVDNPKIGGQMEELLARQYDKEFIGRGYFRSEAQPLIPLNMGAAFVEVEVDTDTGYVKLLNAVAVTDCGVPINPDIVEGQIQGAFIMGASYALGDHIITDPSTGRIVNPDFYGYKVLLASDCPNIEPVIVDSWDPLGKVGQKGVGEAFVIAGPGAVGNAIYNAIGVRVKDLPFTPQKILTALGKL